MFYPQERLALFIDGANLYAAARALSFDIDYKRLLNLFAQRGRLIRAFYYTALIEDQEYSPIRPLVDWLDYNGYTMVTKPTKEYTDAYGRRKVKGNMDIELAIDVMEMCDNVDHIVLFSGDGDFRCLVEAAQRKGVRVTVVSTVRSNPPMVADELRRQADHFMELMDLAPSISRTPTESDESDFGYDQPAHPYGGDAPSQQPAVEGYEPYQSPGLSDNDDEESIGNRRTDANDNEEGSSPKKQAIAYG
jgi:uncharacterized LabA/DUF88 family protein